MPTSSVSERVNLEKIVPEKHIANAKIFPTIDLLLGSANSTTQVLDLQKLVQNPPLAERLLNQAILEGNAAAISHYLNAYQQIQTIPLDQTLIAFAQAQLAKKQGNYAQAIASYRQILAEKPELTPVRIQLAISLFQTQQDNAAEEQFEKALSDPHLPTDIAQLVQSYLQALEHRNGWQLSFSTHFVKEDNVNNVSSDAQIENTPFRKNQAMMPEKATGFAYFAGVERDFNLTKAHYFHLENQLYGKSYWDNHAYDEMTNRLSLGYVHKAERQRFALLPFYEQQWYGNHRYKRTIGGRAEFTYWLNPNWQWSQAVEFGQNIYQNIALNGTSKLLSSTLLWRPSPRYFFYAGADYVQERSKIRHYGYDLKTVRLGWGKEWGLGISSRVSLSASHRLYKDNLVLGSVFRFDKRREEAIYQLNLTAWKRDWHLWGITPKLNFRWKKQDSNFRTLYSYTDKSVNLLFEKTF